MCYQLLGVAVLRVTHDGAFAQFLKDGMNAIRQNQWQWMLMKPVKTFHYVELHIYASGSVSATTAYSITMHISAVEITSTDVLADRKKVLNEANHKLRAGIWLNAYKKARTKAKQNILVCHLKMRLARVQ
jgi:hypothetical protein